MALAGIKKKYIIGLIFVGSGLLTTLIGIFFKRTLTMWLGEFLLAISWVFSASLFFAGKLYKNRIDIYTEINFIKCGLATIFLSFLFFAAGHFIESKLPFYPIAKYFATHNEVVDRELGTISSCNLAWFSSFQFSLANEASEKVKIDLWASGVRQGGFIQVNLIKGNRFWHVNNATLFVDGRDVPLVPAKGM